MEKVKKDKFDRVPAKDMKSGDNVYFGSRNQDGRLLLGLPEFMVQDDGHTLTLISDSIKISFDKMHPDYKKYAAHICVDRTPSIIGSTKKIPIKKPVISKALNGNAKVVHIASRPHRYPLENYSRYSDGDELFVGPSTGKDIFARLVKNNTINGLSTIAGISDRIVKVDRDKQVMALLNKYPGHMLLLSKETLELKKVLDF